MPAPELNLCEAVEIYLSNRAGLYDSLLTRLPEAAIRNKLREIAEPLVPAPPLTDALRRLSFESDGELMAALKLLDVMKKPGFGAALGKTTISVEEAMNRALQLEETGVLLFMLLATFDSVFANEFEARKRTLARLIRLDDELRYHRLRLARSS